MSLVCQQDRSSVPVSMPEVVDLDELPDFDIQNRSSRPISTLGVVDLDTFSDFNIDTGFAYSLARGKQVIVADQLVKPVVNPELDFD